MQKLTASLLIAGAALCGVAQAENAAYEAAVNSMKNEMSAGIAAAGVVAIDSLMPEMAKGKRIQSTSQPNFVALPRLLQSSKSSETL